MLKTGISWVKEDGSDHCVQERESSPSRHPLNRLLLCHQTPWLQGNQGQYDMTFHPLHREVPREKRSRNCLRFSTENQLRCHLTAQDEARPHLPSPPSPREVGLLLVKPSIKLCSQNHSRFQSPTGRLEVTATCVVAGWPQPGRACHSAQAQGCGQRAMQGRPV